MRDWSELITLSGLAGLSLTLSRSPFGVGALHLGATWWTVPDEALGLPRVGVVSRGAVLSTLVSALSGLVGLSLTLWRAPFDRCSPLGGPRILQDLKHPLP